MNFVSRWCGAVLVMALLMTGAGLTAQPAAVKPTVKILTSFEGRAGSGKNAWSSNVPKGVTFKHATHLKQSFWVMLRSTGARVQSPSRLLEADWSGFERLLLDVFVEGSPFALDIEILDQHGSSYLVPAYYLRSGANTIEVDLAGAATELDLTAIDRLLFRVSGGVVADNTAYFDNLRLTVGVPPPVPTHLLEQTSEADVLSNLISNPGFENALAGWQFWGAFEWARYTAGVAGGKEAHSGSQCATIKVADYFRGRGGLACERVWPPHPGAYRVSLYVRGKGGAIFRLGLANATFADAAVDVPAPPAWTELSYQITIPSDREPVRLWLYNVGMGTLYLDDVMLVPETPTEDTTTKGVHREQADVRLSGDTLSVNGTPLYPIGVLGCEDPSELADTPIGVAVMSLGARNSASFLDACQEAGLMGIVNLAGRLRTHSPVPVASVVRKAAPHPALLGWLLAEEPDSKTHAVAPPEIRLVRQMLGQETGADVPVLLHLQADYRSSMYQYGDLADVVVISVPAAAGPRFDKEEVTGRIDRVKKVRKGRGPVWVILDLGPDPGVRTTPEHLRLVAYLAATHGAQGIVWYPYGAVKAARPVWDALMEVSEELRKLTPALISPPVQVITATNKIGMHGTARRYQDLLYLIILNSMSVEQPGATFSLADVPDGTTVEVLFEERTLTVQDGKITDDFAPLQRHVYRLIAPAETP